MQQMTIRNLGPIREVVLDVTQANVLIGPQAGGKSTIAKCVYYFKALKLEMGNFLLNHMSDRLPAKITSFSKKARELFLQFWGGTRSWDALYLHYVYHDDVHVEITLSKSEKFVNITFSQALVDGFKQLNTFARQNHRTQTRSSRVPQFNDWSTNHFREKLASRLDELFAFSHDLLYIPAGRSLVTTLSDHLSALQTYKMDFLLEDFVNRVNRSKGTFAQSLEELVEEHRGLRDGEPDMGAVNLAVAIIGRILKGEYRAQRDGEKLYFGRDRFAYLKFASSGQQEAIWITHLVFLYILEQRQVFAVFEEPEAHLYPDAQREMVRLMVLLLTRKGNSGIITTHSPYILTSLNNSLYAHQVGRRQPEKVGGLMPAELWLDPAETRAFFVDNGYLEDIMDESLAQIRGERVDAASTTINEEYDALFELDEAP